MKVTFYFFILLALISCGKKNESGKPERKFQEVIPYTEIQEEEFKRDFLRTGQDLLNHYGEKIRVRFGTHALSQIRRRLHPNTIQVTAQIIMNDRNEIVRSFYRHNVLYLYIGEGNLDWIRAKKGDSMKFKRLVLHELLGLGDINDDRFRISDQLLRGR